jgi:HSP20 family protein
MTCLSALASTRDIPLMKVVTLAPLTGELSEQLRARLRRLLTQIEGLQELVPATGSWMPPIDLCERADAILVRVEIPGVSAEDVKITLREGVLKIEGRKKHDPAVSEPGAAESGPARFLCLERAYGTFVRSLSLKWSIDIDRVSARLANGVLEIQLPKARSCGQEIIITITE